MVRRKYELLNPELNERSRRYWAATEAMELGYGGISIVVVATGLVFNTVKRGIQELEAQHRGEVEPLPIDRIRHPGGGRKKLTDKDPALLPDLDKLVDPVTRGDPESPLRWTSKSTEKLAFALQEQDHYVSPDTVGRLLKVQGYSLQANRKTYEGNTHPDRDAQFQYIYSTTKNFQQKNQPVISVDTKKKELIGNFKNGGKEWQPAGAPIDVNVYDFVDKKLGKAIPYGVYDILHDEGWVNVGIDRDTAQFAAHSILQWWERMGKKRYPKAKELLITADCGGSNGRRTRLWKVELQRLADELGITIHVRHFPPGTSKWNKIEHRMFAFISKNWRGKPLLDRTTVINLIANTTTTNGLRIEAALDANTYQKGIKISDREMKSLNFYKEDFHGEWNYRLEPRGQS
jgi:hypothetical protein